MAIHDNEADICLRRPMEPAGYGPVEPELDRLPALVRNAVFALAKSQQVSTHLALICVLGTLSFAASPFHSVQLPSRHVIPICTFCVGTAESSARKTSTLDLVMRGIERAQVEIEAHCRRAVDKYEIQLRNHDCAVRLATKEGRLTNSELEALVDAKPKKPKRWTVRYNKYTLAGLTTSLAEGPGHVSLVATEVRKLMDKDFLTTAADLNSYFSGEANDKALGGPTQTGTARTTSLSFLLLGQLDVLDDVERPIAKMLRDMGYTARVLYVDCPPSLPEHAQPLFKAADVEQILKDYNDTCHDMLVDNLQEWKHKILELDTQATTLYHQYSAKMRESQRGAGSDIADLLSKAPEIAVRMAGQLCRATRGKVISAADFAAATDLMDFFLVQGRARYGAGALWKKDREHIAKAITYLTEWCQDENGSQTYLRSDWQQRARPGSLREKAVRDFVLIELERVGMLQVQRVDGKTYLILNPSYFPVRPYYPPPNYFSSSNVSAPLGRSHSPAARGSWFLQVPSATPEPTSAAEPKSTLGTRSSLHDELIKAALKAYGT
jgi:hypothetical protein